jgi:acyl-CoA hydrolase
MTQIGNDQTRELTVSRSRVEMTQVVLPQFANAIGTVFGGQIVSWIDICAAVSAGRHCRTPVVTASIDSVHFVTPVKLGHVVILKSQINAVFTTSLEVGTVVYAEHPLTGEVTKAARAYCTFVSLDDVGMPKRIPHIILESDEDRRRAKDAETRRRHRLVHRRQEIAHG